jgi:Uma2 family endonuclease
MLLSQTKPVRGGGRRRRPADPSPSAEPRVLGEMTYEQFLQLDGDVHAEWVDGKVIEMAPVTDEHSALQMFFVKIIGAFVDAHELGELRAEPFQMKTGPDMPGRAPDLMFIAKRNLSRLKKHYLAGPADLVIEIISPGTMHVDRGAKYGEYEQGGVKEYWLIDPLRKQADFYLRGRDGLYQRAAVESDCRYHSRVLKGLWLDVDWLWQKPLPSSVFVRKAWKLP